jgi:hypothetical protein
MIMNRMYEHQNRLSLSRVSVRVGLRTYPHPCTVPLLMLLLCWSGVYFGDNCVFVDYNKSNEI